MSKTKIILNPLYEFVTQEGKQEIPQELMDSPDMQLVYAGEKFILKNDDREKYLIVSHTIKVFLEAFAQATTLKKVIAHFAQQIGVTPDKIEAKIKSFYEDMMNRGVLIKDEKKDSVDRRKGRGDIFIADQIVDGYKIIKKLADKSRVQLFVAEDMATAQEVVIKARYISPSVTGKKRDKSLRFFLQEFEIMEELKGHNHLCQLIDYQPEAAIPYAVMQYIKGQSLRRFLKHNTPNLTHKITQAENMLSALAFMHKRDIIHGDLHSSNFLFDEAGIVTIIDFDLSNHVKLKKGELYKKGGVHEYIPPENIGKCSFEVTQKRATKRSEVFQTGVMLYYLIYGHLPFKAITWDDLTRKIKSAPANYEAATLQGEIVPAYLIEIMQKAMSKKPKDRYKSVNKMHKAFCKAQKAMSVVKTFK